MATDLTRRLGRGAGLAGVFGGMLLALFVAADRPHRASAQEPKQPAKKAMPPADFNAGIGECVFCHYGSDKDKAVGFAKYKSTEFVRLNESSTWEGKDPHSKAFAVLSEPLGKQMLQNLKIKDIAEAPQCLTCHAVDMTPTAKLAGKTFAVDDGVSCNGCHGLKETWQSKHYKAPMGNVIPWRTAAPAEKLEAGMNDLRNPVVKAKLCASCHVGSPSQGKVVTHDMYAAGHPPLPPFELVTYIEGEPRHWGYPTELPYFKTVPADKQWDLYRFHPADQESYLARHLAAGAVAASLAEAELLEADAEKGEGIDFARFDCYACHPDLTYPSDRQKRGYPDGAPGRPTLRVSTGALAGVVADHAAGIADKPPKSDGVNALKGKATGFHDCWAALRRAAVDRPYGDPKKVAEAAKAHIAWCNGFLQVQHDARDPLYTPGAARQLATMLAAAAATPRNVADPEAAFDFVWAYTALAREEKLPLAADKLEKLGQVVPLTVRAEPFSQPGNGKDKAGPVTARFADRMRRLNAYSADNFLAPFKDLTGTK
jgi:hypothetical protein